jgi:hypothetical protein
MARTVVEAISVAACLDAHENGPPVLIGMDPRSARTRVTIVFPFSRGAILWFDPRREHSSDRPPNRTAVARRACQGWPRLRGHPQGLALTGPSTAAHSIGSGLVPPARNPIN